MAFRSNLFRMFCLFLSSVFIVEMKDNEMTHFNF